MKILHVIYSLEMGGAEKLLTDLVPQQKKLGHNVDVCIFNKKQTPFEDCLRENGTKIITIECSKKHFDIRRIPPLRKLMMQYDIIHAHCAPPLYSCAFASILSNCKLITTEHSTNNKRRKKKWLKPLEYWIYSRYSAIIGCSDKATKMLQAYLPKLENRIKCIPNGINIAQYTNANSGTALPPRIENEFRLVMIGRFHYPKNQELLIKAVYNLDNNVLLYLVGDGENLNTCKSAVKELNVNERVHFLGIRNDIPQILKSVDVMVHSSYWEGLPISILEGMAAGLPIIASNSPGIREIVHGTGLLFDADSLEQLFVSINRLKKDIKYLSDLSGRSLAQVKKFDIKQMAKQYLSTYNIHSEI